MEVLPAPDGAVMMMILPVAMCKEKAVTVHFKFLVIKFVESVRILHQQP